MMKGKFVAFHDFATRSVTILSKVFPSGLTAMAAKVVNSPVKEK